MTGVPAGTIRTATTRRLVEAFGDLDGFSTDPTDGLWWVTRPLSSPAKNRRIVVVGAGETLTIEPDGIASGHGPSFDTWTIPCVLGVTDDPTLDLEAAEQACEDAFNQLCDWLAANDRLGPDSPGCFGVHPISLAIHSVWESGKPPAAWAEFELQAQAIIERNP